MTVMAEIPASPPPALKKGSMHRSYSSDSLMTDASPSPISARPPGGFPNWDTVWDADAMAPSSPASLPKSSSTPRRVFLQLDQDNGGEVVRPSDVPSACPTGRTTKRKSSVRRQSLDFLRIEAVAPEIAGDNETVTSPTGHHVVVFSPKLEEDITESGWPTFTSDSVQPPPALLTAREARSQSFSRNAARRKSLDILPLDTQIVASGQDEKVTVDSGQEVVVFSPITDTPSAGEGSEWPVFNMNDVHPPPALTSARLSRKSLDYVQLDFEDEDEEDLFSRCGSANNEASFPTRQIVPPVQIKADLINKATPPEDLITSPKSNRELSVNWNNSQSARIRRKSLDVLSLEAAAATIPDKHNTEDLVQLNSGQKLVVFSPQYDQVSTIDSNDASSWPVFDAANVQPPPALMSSRSADQLPRPILKSQSKSFSSPLLPVNADGSQASKPSQPAANSETSPIIVPSPPKKRPTSPLLSDPSIRNILNTFEPTTEKVSPNSINLNDLNKLSRHRSLEPLALEISSKNSSVTEPPPTKPVTSPVTSPSRRNTVGGRAQRSPTSPTVHLPPLRRKSTSPTSPPDRNMPNPPLVVSKPSTANSAASWFGEVQSRKDNIYTNKLNQEVRRRSEFLTAIQEQTKWLQQHMGQTSLSARNEWINKESNLSITSRVDHFKLVSSAREPLMLSSEL